MNKTVLLLLKIKIIADALVNSLLSHKQPELSKSRLAICATCPQRHTFTAWRWFLHVCKVCGCILYLKTEVETEVCPLGKW